MRLDWYGGKQPKRGGGGLVDQVGVATTSSGPSRPAVDPGEAIGALAPRAVEAVVMPRPATGPALTPAGRLKTPR